MRNFLGTVLTAMVMTTGGAGAETAGAYVHGELRKADREVYYCHEKHVAYYMARLYNSLNADAYPDERHRDRILGKDAEYFRRTGQCAVATEIDHTSLETLLKAPAVKGPARHVVKSRMIHSFGYARINYVVTGNDVPPCAARCARWW